MNMFFKVVLALTIVFFVLYTSMLIPSDNQQRRRDSPRPSFRLSSLRIDTGHGHYDVSADDFRVSRSFSELDLVEQDHIEDPAWISNVSTLTLDKFFKQNRRSIEPFVAKYLENKLQEAARHKKYRPVLVRMGSYSPPSDEELKRLHQRRSSQDVTDEVMLQFLTDSFHDSFSNYENRVKQLELSVQFQKDFADREMKRRKEQEKKCALFTNTITALLTTLITALVCKNT